MMIPVVCAVIQKNGMVLCALRSQYMKMPLKWEFPGGKVEKGESPEESLIREIHEELGISIQVLRPFTTVSHAYPDFSIQLIPFSCTIREGLPQAREHAELRWVHLSKLKELDWAEADLPLVDEILRDKDLPASY